MAKIGYRVGDCLIMLGFKEGFWGANDARGMPEYFFFGAVRLDYKSAERADVEKQNYTVCPRCWYVDATFVCRDCNTEFVFSVSEQRFWYEDRRFYVDSLPRRCVRCRKMERARLELKKDYDASIAGALSSKTGEEKKRLIEIIDELEAAEGSISERMREKREVLRAQLAKMQ
jgi:hypothetical protein